jgi:hypothetical protein
MAHRVEGQGQLVGRSGSPCDAAANRLGDPAGHGKAGALDELLAVPPSTAVAGVGHDHDAGAARPGELLDVGQGNAAGDEAFGVVGRLPTRSGSMRPRL